MVRKHAALPQRGKDRSDSGFALLALQAWNHARSTSIRFSPPSTLTASYNKDILYSITEKKMLANRKYLLTRKK